MAEIKKWCGSYSVLNKEGKGKTIGYNRGMTWEGIR